MAEWKTSRPILLAALALLGLGVLGALAGLGALGYIKSGLFNVAASKPHTKLTQWVTEETMKHSIRRHARAIEVPRVRYPAARILYGFCEYETRCVACHGAAAVPRGEWASGMEPKPPYLLDATERWTPAELFWIVQNGIKMTGMPSWRASLSDEQIWDLVAWLEAARRMPPQTYLRWRAERPCARFTPLPFPGSSPTPRP
ncbi:MAG: c-type cytochrome [Sphingomicrobium sp.]